MPLRTKSMIGWLGLRHSLAPIPMTLNPLTQIVMTLSTPRLGIDAQPLLAAAWRHT